MAELAEDADRWEAFVEAVRLQLVGLSPPETQPVGDVHWEALDGLPEGEQGALLPGEKVYRFSLSHST